MGKYLDPKADLTFKKIFGEHKNLVISLLNALLPLNDDERVESIEYWPAEKIPKRTQVEKDSIVDVCCKDNKQREFIVEMQMTWTESFKKRVLFNASKAYVAQSESGEKYTSLQPVYALNFVNEPMHVDVDDYYHHYQLVHQQNSEEIIDGLQLVFIELPKFKPSTLTEKKMQVLWLRFLTEINAKTKEAPAELLENPEVSQALKIVEEAAYSDAEMHSYNKFWDAVSTQKTLIYDWELKIEKAKAKLEQAESKLEKVESKLEKTESKLEKTESKLEKTESKLEQAEQAVVEAEAKVEQAEQAVVEAEAKAEQAEAKLKDAELQKFETARKLKAMHIMTNAQIAEATGLTTSEIETL